MNTSKPYKKILYNTSLLTIMQVIGDFSGLMLYVVLSRFYGPEGVGVYAFGLSVALIAFYFINFGFDDYGIRECSLIDQDKRKILIGRIVAVQLILLAFVTISFISFIWLIAPSLEYIIVVFSILVNMVLLAFSKTFFIPLNAQERMILPAVLEVSMKILNVVAISLIIIFLKVPVYIALLPYTLFGVFSLILSLRSFKKFTGKFKINFSWEYSVSLIKIIWPFSASQLIHSIYARTGVIILTLVIGNAAAGIYAPAQKFLEVALMPVVFFNFSIYPVLSKYNQQNYEKFEDSAEKLFRAIFIIASILLWILYYIIPVLIVPLLGEKFIASISIIKYFSLLIFLNSFTVSFHKLLLSANFQILRTKAHFFALLINLVASFSLISYFGPKGAVIALIVSEVALNLLFMNIIHNKSFLLFKKLIKAFGQFLFSFIIALIAAIVFNYLPISDLYAMFAVILLFIIGIFATGFASKFDIKFVNPFNMITKRL